MRACSRRFCLAIHRENHGLAKIVVSTHDSQTFRDRRVTGRATFGASCIHRLCRMLCLCLKIIVQSQIVRMGEFQQQSIPQACQSVLVGLYKYTVYIESPSSQYGSKT